MKLLLVVFVLLASIATAQAEIKTKTIKYEVDNVTFTGYLAYDDKIKVKRPGILIVHEWWGHNDYSQKRARMLAELGYTAFALDMYGSGKKAEHPKDAAKFSTQVMAQLDVAETRFRKALQILKQHRTTQSTDIAAIGYCFGGTIVLEMVRRGVELDAVASFHGSMKTITTPRPGTIKTKVLVLNGKADPFVKKEQIIEFKKVMQTAKIQYEFVNYEAAKHSFTNPGATKIGQKFKIPLEYNEKADKASWKKMQTLFKKVFN